MLTKTDLNQIRGVVREEVGVQLKPLRTIIREEVRVQLKPLIKEVENLKRRIIKVEKSLIRITDFLDHEHLKLERRVERVESHLGFPSPI